MKKTISLMLAVLLMIPLVIPAFAAFDNTHNNTGNYIVDIVDVAKTQIGYTAKDTDSKYGHASDGGTTTWSGAFVSWCAYQAAIPDEIVPKMASPSKLYAFFGSGNDLHINDGYVPKKGDIVFFGKEEKITCCGIVTSSDDKFFSVIIGDIEDTVREMTYILSAPSVLAVASPEYNVTVSYEKGTHITTASFLNFRTGPGTDYPVISRIPLGTILNITDIVDGWGQVSYNGSDGYVSMDYVKEFKDSHLAPSQYAVLWNVVDLSRWNGSVDFAKVAEAGFSAVILRIGGRYSKSKEFYDDENFKKYYNDAKEAGLYVGCYFYSAATNVNAAREEAYFVIDQINENGYSFDMPVFIDMEDSVIQKEKTDSIKDITLSFLETAQAANLYAGVYCSTSWADDYYTYDMFIDTPLWIADWRSECQYKGNYGMWQYSEKGIVSGTESPYTDLNICYYDYPAIIKAGGYNNLSSTPAERKTGDVSGDGKITVVDARMALRAASGIIRLREAEKKAADLNGDGKVTPAEARKILRVAAQIDTF